MSDITTEVRFECPKDIVDVFDAISFANGDKSRNVEIIKALKAYADHQVHVALMITKVAVRNPAPVDNPRQSDGG
jgi:hypothetical protein